MDEQDWESKLTEQINDVSSLLTSVYQAAETEMFLSFMFEDTFTVADLAAYPSINNTFKKVIQKLTVIAVGNIENSIKKSWDISNRKNDALVDAYFKGWQGADVNTLKESYQNENLAVRNAFIERKTNGLNLSERVWKYNEGYKQEIEDALQIGISNGVSAKKMAGLLRDYLRNPTATIMEVDKAGVATQLLAQNHPGQGVYRDPMKNALRLARTETNIAYRTADTTRYAQLDFIVGYEVHLSKNHTSGHGKHIVDLHDICDELQGKYPKDFKFSGWHPNCRCYMTTILKTQKEMERDEELIRKGEQPSPESKNTVTEGKPPTQLRQWTKANTDRLEKSTSLPYFVRDNMSYFSNVNFNDTVMAQFKESAAMKKAALLEKAKIRHESRTPQEIQDIKDRWAARQKAMRKQAILNKAAERHAARTPQQIADIQARWAERKQTNIIVNGGKRYLSAAGGFKFDNSLLNALETAIGKRDPKQIESAIAELRKTKNSVKQLQYIQLDDFRQFTAPELEAASSAAKSKVQQLAGQTLAKQKAKLEFEINYVSQTKKYPTWKIAERAYKAELAEVEYQIHIEPFKIKVADFKAIKGHSTAYNKAVKEAENMLSGAKLTAADEANLDALFKQAEGEFLKKHKYIQASDFGKFTAAELEAANTAIENKLAYVQAQSLANQQQIYIKEIANLSTYKKFNTWQIAEREYKLQLQAVEYKIRINEYTDRLSALKTFKTTDKTFVAHLKKAVEDYGYATYKTTPPTPSIDKVTKAQVDKAITTWLNAKPQYLPYVQDPVGGVFKGGANYITGYGNYDAWTNCQKFAKKMQGFGVDVTPEEVSIIAQYTYKSGFINKYLLKGAYPPPSAAQAKLLDNYKIALNGVLTKLPKYQGVSFRGGCLDKAKLANGSDDFWNSLMDAWNKGGVWESTTPMSTTANVDTPAFFGSGITSSINPPSNRQRILFVVKGKTGVSVSDISIDKKQDEVLFRASSKFKMTKKPYQITNKNAPYGDVGDYLVELEEI